MTELRLTTLAGIAGFCIAALAGCDQMGMPSAIGETAYVIGSPSRPFYPDGMDGKFHEMNVVCTVTSHGTAQDCSAVGPDSSAALGAAGIAWTQTLQFHPLTVRGSFYDSRLMLEVPFQPRYVPGGPDVSVSEVPLSGPGADMDINRPGKATVGCSIDTTGLTHDCTVESQSGDPFVAREALRFMQHRQFLPAMHNGMPVPVAHHVSNFDVHM